MESWPHAPSRIVDHPGTYFVTSGTYQKQHFFRGEDRLGLLQEQLLTTLADAGWELQQWAVFSNHYHFVGFSPETGPNLPKLLGKVHTLTSRDLNQFDGAPGRKVWYRYRDTRITYPRSYLARLNYVRCNAVKHRLVRVPEDYEFCSAAWFARHADKAFFETVASFQTDQLEIDDDY